MSIVEQAAVIWRARRYLERDPDLAIYTVRDLQVTADAGLTNPAWALGKYRGTRGEAENFLDTLTDHIQEVYNAGINRE